MLSTEVFTLVVSDCVFSPDKDGHFRSLENMKNLVTIIKVPSLILTILISKKPLTFFNEVPV
jgi:hypothetical protein